MSNIEITIGAEHRVVLIPVSNFLFIISLFFLFHCLKCLHWFQFLIYCFQYARCYRLCNSSVINIVVVVMVFIIYRKLKKF